MGNNPDKYDHNSERDSEMRQMTKQYLKAWNEYNNKGKGCR